MSGSLHDCGVRHAIGLGEPLRGIEDLLLHPLDVLKALLQLLADDEPAHETALSGTRTNIPYYQLVGQRQDSNQRQGSLTPWMVLTC